MVHTIKSTSLKQDLFYHMVSTFPCLVCVVDEVHHIVYTNRLYETTIESEGRYNERCAPFSAGDSKDVSKIIEVVLTQGKLQNLKGYRYHRQDGEAVWFDLQFQPLELDEEKRYVLITGMDVTDKYQSRRRVKDQTYILEHMVQSISDPLVVFNHQIEEVYGNRAFHALLPKDSSASPMEALLKEYSFKDFKNKDIKLRMSPLLRAIKGEYVDNFELQLTNRNTYHSTYYYVSTRPIHLETSEQPLYVMVMRDISKGFKESISQKDLIQIAAHELRTPLTSIKGFTQLVLERYKERGTKWFFQPTMKIKTEMERDQSFFKVIMDESIRLDQLTHELLSVYKIDQGKFDIKLEGVSFIPIVQEALEEFIMPTSFHQVHLDSTVTNPFVQIDTNQIKRVIHNLLSNAIKYSPNCPDIHVQIKIANNRLVFSVQDQGIGIPKEQHSRIFERFYRAYSPEHAEIEGYGVGLHICQAIMRMHGGEIGFTSTYGEGSTFYFLLPYSLSQ